MKRSSRSLTRVLAILALGAAFSPLTAQLQSGLGQRVGEGSERHAESLLQQSIQAIEAVPSLTAQIRQRIRVEGESLVGSGAYQQATYGRDCLFRLDLKIPLGGDRVSTLIQVCDGRFLWTYRGLPEVEEPEIARVDLNEVRRQPQSSGIVAFGGIPHTMRQIARNYAMKEAATTQLQGVPVWQLTGRLRPRPSSADAEEGKGGPDRVPPWVLLFIGQDDLLPYRIEFRDRPTSGDSDRLATADEEQTVAMDFFEVQVGAQIDPRAFAFQPRDDRPVKNVTAAYIRETEPR